VPDGQADCSWDRRADKTFMHAMLSPPSLSLLLLLLLLLLQKPC